MPVSGQAAWGPHPITALGQHQMVTALLHPQNLLPYTYPVTLISSGDALALFPQAWATSPQLRCWSVPEALRPPSQATESPSPTAATHSQDSLGQGHCLTLSYSAGETEAQRGAGPCAASHSNSPSVRIPLYTAPTPRPQTQLRHVPLSVKAWSPRS